MALVVRRAALLHSQLKRYKIISRNQLRLAEVTIHRLTGPLFIDHIIGSAAEGMRIAN